MSAMIIWLELDRILQWWYDVPIWIDSIRNISFILSFCVFIQDVLFADCSRWPIE